MVRRHYNEDAWGPYGYDGEHASVSDLAATSSSAASCFVSEVARLSIARVSLLLSETAVAVIHITAPPNTINSLSLQYVLSRAHRRTDSYGAETDCILITTPSTPATPTGIYAIPGASSVTSLPTYGIPPYDVSTSSSVSEGYNAPSGLGFSVPEEYNVASSTSSDAPLPTYDVPPYGDAPTSSPAFDGYDTLSHVPPGPALSAPGEYDPVSSTSSDASSSTPVYGDPVPSSSSVAPVDSTQTSCTSSVLAGNPSVPVPALSTSSTPVGYPSYPNHSVPALPTSPTPAEYPSVPAHSVSASLTKSATAEYPSTPVYSAPTLSTSSNTDEYPSVPMDSIQTTCTSSALSEYSSVPVYGVPASSTPVGYLSYPAYTIPASSTSSTPAKYPSTPVYTIPAHSTISIPVEYPPSSIPAPSTSSAPAGYLSVPPHSIFSVHSVPAPSAGSIPAGHPSAPVNSIFPVYSILAPLTSPAPVGYLSIPAYGIPTLSVQLYRSTSVPPTVTRGLLESSPATPTHPSASPPGNVPTPFTHQSPEEYRPSSPASSKTHLVYVSIPVYPIPSSEVSPQSYVSGILVNGSTSLIVAATGSTYGPSISVQGPSSTGGNTPTPSQIHSSVLFHNPESLGNAYGGGYSGVSEYSTGESVATMSSNSEVPPTAGASADPYSTAETPTIPGPGQNLTVTSARPPVAGYTGSALKTSIHGTNTAFICLLVALSLL
ncbi:hypothetical protein FGG08_005926 [Glutinoglossum americanum]|uniref:Uncharacterized protein n=1 Tax=Glutinoglossum americanum TaxID=1670608 RepID=A0A9P8HXG0_9PEZI|nr:hypothetical protein FGG08_005926 [Glutinoglossum americanum]